MKKFQLILAGIFGFSAVAFVAFGTHVLRDSLSEHMLDVYRIGLLYHLIHAVVLFAIAYQTES